MDELDREYRTHLFLVIRDNNPYHDSFQLSRPEIFTKSAGWEPPSSFRNDLMSRSGGEGKSLTKKGIMLASALIKMPRKECSLKIQNLYSRHG